MLNTEEENAKGIYSSDDQIAKILEKYPKLEDSDRKFLDGRSKHDYLQYFEEFVENNAGAEKIENIRDEFKDFPRPMK